ncbi:MAG: hypothetical protein KME05_05820 [Gloeocapsa sp. UFS-A4-WI-NPMV-4B04]|jgi:hypothetical protein|nr:hypothetical protein [Gloeocapsa sp. UFS-A4-WI-NPMV-4B04]
MENNQSTQQDSSQLDSSKERLNHRKSVGAANLKSLLNLIKRSPWLIWSGLWILLLVTSVIAILSLTHPLGVEQEPESKPVAVEKPTEPPLQTGKPTESLQTGRPILWLVGAAAITVAVGSLLILKRLNSSVDALQLSNTAKRGPTRRQQRKILLQENLLHQAPSEPVADEIKPVGTIPPVAATDLLHSSAPSLVVADNVSLDANVRGNNSLNSQTEVPEVPLRDSHALNSDEKMFAEPDDRISTPDNNLNAQLEPVVTVLPPEESDLLDSADKSLAELMDIRKHRSLSSILHDP